MQISRQISDKTTRQPTHHHDQHQEIDTHPPPSIQTPPNRFSIHTPLLPIRHAAIDLLARLLDLLQHRLVGEVGVGVDLGRLGRQVDRVGLDA